jgi:hypothetical protein
MYIILTSGGMVRAVVTDLDHYAAHHKYRIEHGQPGCGSLYSATGGHPLTFLQHRSPVDGYKRTKAQV